jgi:hypothetical protein
MLLLATSPLRAQDAAHDAALLQRAAWLAGCWGMDDGAVHSTEIWMEPAGGVMLGMSRTVDGGETDGEFLEISVDGQHLVYTAIPEGQTETSFISTEISDSLIEFENAEHDFPQRIIYRRYSRDSLVARIEGDDEDGLRAYEYPMRRIPCPGTKAQPLIGSALIKGHDVLFGDEVDAYDRSDARAFPIRLVLLSVIKAPQKRARWSTVDSVNAPSPGSSS